MRVRFLSFLLSICIGVTFLLTGCYHEVEVNESDLLPEREMIVPLKKGNFPFYTYSEFIDWFKDEKNAIDNRTEWGQDYVDYFSEVGNSPESAPLYVPYYGDAPAELRQRDGYSAVTFMSADLYCLPWVWYYVEIEGETLIFSVACLSQRDFERVSVESASIAVKNFDRSGPNIDNFKSKENYKSITEKKIHFAGQEILALYQDRNDGPRDALQFVFDKTMILIRGTPEILNSHHINMLSIQRVDLGT